jgi:hypothetical protein
LRDDDDRVTDERSTRSRCPTKTRIGNNVC